MSAFLFFLAVSNRYIPASPITATFAAFKHSLDKPSRRNAFLSDGRSHIVRIAHGTPQKRVIRWQWILFVSGGLLVNLALLAIAWILLRSETPLLAQNVLQALILTNAFSIVENLLPYTVHTFEGPVDTDGKQLYHALFYWNKPLLPSKPPGRVQRAFFIGLRIIVVTFLSLCAILLLFLGGFVLYDLPGHWVVRISLGLFILGLGVILTWYIWRLFSTQRSAPTRYSPGPAASPFSIEPPSTFTTNSGSPECDG